MRKSLQVMAIMITVMIPPTFAGSVTGCGPGYSDHTLECTAHGTGDGTGETIGRAADKVGECARIEKLLANPKMRVLMMQEPESKQMVWWYAGNCPLGKSKG
jgi:hypothetical protein